MSAVISGPRVLFPGTYIVGAAVLKGRAVKRGADANHVIHGTAASVNVGIALDDQDTAERNVLVAHRAGEAPLAEAGAAFALDARLTSDANGRLVAATTGQSVIAIARQAATALGQYVVVEVVQGGTVTAP